MVNWLDFFNVNYDYEIKREHKMFVRRHVSGHASKPELKEIIDKINPAKIVPIHSDHPELFEEMFKEKVLLPKDSQAIEV